MNSTPKVLPIKCIGSNINPQISLRKNSHIPLQLILKSLTHQPHLLLHPPPQPAAPKSYIQAQHHPAEDDIEPVFCDPLPQCQIGAGGERTGGPVARYFDAVYGGAEGLVVPLDHPVRQCAKL